MQPEIVASAKSHLKQHGWCVVPNVLSRDEAGATLERLWAAADEFRRRGGETYMSRLDPNEANVRVFNLLDIDPVFRDLIRRPIALGLVAELLGPSFLISNFTANIARPGSGSMSLHSDQALVVPEPWLEPWSINIIWCLTDVTAENGATLYLPGSHKVTRLAEVDQEPTARLTPFAAKAGSILAMDGRVWHTSGRNVTADQDRALMFAYYSRAFLRQQVNWYSTLSPDVLAGLDDEMRRLLGLDPTANREIGARLLASNVGGVRGAAGR